MKTAEDRKNNFSVALGLTDYVNPILYTVPCLTIIMNIDEIMRNPWKVLYIAGAVLSVVFGLMIPTVKLLVGLGKIEFKLPVSFVFCVNTGIFVSGLMLIKNIFDMHMLAFAAVILAAAAILALVYLQTKRINNLAVLIGAIGYMLIYISLIAASVKNGAVLPVVLYAFAICLYVMLVGIGLKGNLKDARVHWVIELSNILCQALVAVGTVCLFKGI